MSTGWCSRPRLRAGVSSPHLKQLGRRRAAGRLTRARTQAGGLLIGWRPRAQGNVRIGAGAVRMHAGSGCVGWVKPDDNAESPRGGVGAAVLFRRGMGGSIGRPCLLNRAMRVSVRARPLPHQSASRPARLTGSSNTRGCCGSTQRKVTVPGPVCRPELL